MNNAICARMISSQRRALFRISSACLLGAALFASSACSSTNANSNQPAACPTCIAPVISAMAACIPKADNTTSPDGVPEAGTVGMLSSDSTSCTYADGHTIHASSPFPGAADGGTPNTSPAEVTVTSNGLTCVDIKVDSSSITVVTTAGTVKYAETSVTCPDGSTYDPTACTGSETLAMEFLSIPTLSGTAYHQTYLNTSTTKYQLDTCQ